MATIITDILCDLTQPVAATFLHGNLFSQDNAANTINVHVMDNGEPATIGGTVSANVIRADGATVAVSGAIEGNKAYVILSQACYAVPGRIEIIIKLTQSTTITTIAAIVANVYRSTTDTVVDPGTIIPSVQALIAEIEEAVASIPADYSDLLEMMAEEYSSSNTYKAGDYTWHSGVLKRCIVPIDEPETYNAEHWTDAVLGNDVAGIKTQMNIKFSDFSKISGGYYGTNIQPIVNANYTNVTGGSNFHLASFDGYVWARTPMFKAYKGQTITAVYAGCHLWECTENDISAVDSHTALMENVPVVFDEDCYAFVCSLVNANTIPSSDVVCCILEDCAKYTEKIIFEDEQVTESYDVGEYKSYQSNGTYAYGNATIYRGAAYPYDGRILYTNRPANADAYPIAIATNGKDVLHSAFIQVSLNRGQNSGSIMFCWGETSYNYSTDTLTFAYNFQGNLNGISCDIKNNTLTVTYIYEGSIVTNTASVSPYYQYLFDRMTHVAGCSCQTGTSPNISYYGRGFTDYEDYYRFVRDLNDDSQIADHAVRIAALEEGGGGGGGGGDFDWGKGLDLLTFGQEYLYAWLNALNSGSSFKVLFTGDSTTAYYSGTSNGLKEILQSCMERAGYSGGSYVNRAVSGINASTWLSTYLAGDIAEAPTLYIIRHGFNNEDGTTEEEMAEAFRTAMVSALSEIRANLSVTQCSIILMTPNTSDDDPNHRGQSMKKKLDPIIRQLARAYGCGFIDTFRLWYDPGTYADPMYDDPFGDHRSIHPNGLMNRVIISKLFDFAVPIAYRKYEPDAGA